MKNSKLLLVLGSFDKGEWRKFQVFLKSPYFNKKEEVVHLFSALRTLAPNFDPKKTKKETIYKRLFKNEPFNEKKIDYLMSDLFQNTERFLAIQAFESRPFEVSEHLQEEYLKRKIPKLYHQISKGLNNELSKNPYKNNEYSLNSFRYYEKKDTFFKQLQKRMFDPNIVEATFHFDVYFLSTRLKMACEILDRQKTLSGSYSSPDIEELIAFSEKAQYLNEPSVKLYLLLYRLLKNDTETDFKHYNQFLLEKQNLFPKEEVKNFFLYAINFGIRMIRKGNPEYTLICLSLYENGINNKILLDKGILSPWTFKNVVKLGLRLSRFDWVESFIERSLHLLPKDHQENAGYYNRADLYYYKKDYKKAQQNLLNVEMTDAFYALDARVTLLKIYYEAKEEEALDSLITSFRTFLSRNTNISSNNRQTYLNFIQITSKLAKATKSEKDSILKAIESAKFLTSKKWLVEQAEGI